MIRISMAGLCVGIDPRYDFSRRVAGFETDAEPDFTVRVSAEQIEKERACSKYTSNEYLEYICAYRQIAERLPEFDAFVMHGAVAGLDESKAYMFTAPSGTGKSTHLSLWMLRFPDRVTVVNGDKPIIRKINGVFCACGTPWRGKENWGRDEILPLKGVSLLARSSVCHAERVQPQDALTSVMRQVYVPKNPIHAGKLLDLLNEFLTEIPIYRLFCDRSANAAVLSFETMTGLPAGPEPQLPEKLSQKLHRYDNERLR